MNLGNDNIATLYVGSNEVSRVYLGSDLAWQKEVILTDPINLGAGGTSALACGSPPLTYYIPQGESFFSTTVIYDVSDGSSLAAARFYSNGSTWRQWDGSAFIDTGLC